MVSGARVVMIGESSHGTAEFASPRAKLTRYLVEHHGFQHLLLEGPFASCRGFMPSTSTKARFASGLRRCIPSNWYTEEFADSLTALARDHPQLRPFGFDIQSTELLTMKEL